MLNGVIGAHESPPIDVNTRQPVAEDKTIPDDIQKGLQDAQLLAELGKTDAAIYLLQQLAKAHPENYAILVKLGEMAIEAKNWASAIEVLRKASLLRPKDIDVRLVLMDIYEIYQMPIEEIIVAKEILAFQPQHEAVLKRLAELYRHQALAEDEIETRRQIKRLFPDDYPNLKRLADIFDDNGELWEAAKVYEQIRVYHPKRLNDMRRLAVIYDELDERYRQLEVLDHIAEHGGHRGWMQKKASQRLRQQVQVFDSFQGSSTFRQEEMDELNIDSIVSKATYMHVPLRSSIDLGLRVQHSKLHHTGRGALDGSMNIQSGALSFLGVKYWQGRDYQLKANVGILWDDITGRLFPRDPLSGADENDFPFLRDPTFDSYGGAMAIGGVQFLAQPGLRASYQVGYERGQVEELDARLRMFSFDKVVFGYAYQTSDETTLQLQVDESAISDGNHRFHGLASVYCTLWDKNAMFDYRGRRHDFLRYPSSAALQAGYTLEYFKDQDISLLYESYDDEVRQLGELSYQTRLVRIRGEEDIMLLGRIAYSAGDSLDFRREAGVRLFYYDVETQNEIGLSYAFEEERIDTISQNLRIVGDAEAFMISVYGKWRF